MNPCKHWPGAHNVRDGRPVDNSRRKPRPAARAIYEKVFGPIPPGHDIHHTCENKWCVEATHLVALTAAEHKEAHRRTHCPQGHLLEGDNVYVPPGKPNTRACRTCRRQRSAAFYRATR